MTIALGILASDGVAIAADTQETVGDFKGTPLKIHSAMTKSSIDSTVKAAVAITGAGAGVYLDAIADRIMRQFHKHQDATLSAFEAHLGDCVEDFHEKHVTPLPAHMAREVFLIVGAQIEGERGLWITDASVVNPSPGFAAVGTGAVYARMAIQNRAVHLNVESAAILAILGVMQAKEYDGYCGKSTSVIFLKDNLAHDVPSYLVKQAEECYKRYAGVEYSAFLYALGQRSSDDDKRPRKVNRWLRQLRTEFSNLASQLSQHNP